MNLTRNYEVASSIPGLAQWVKDLVLLWLWGRPAAVALIQLLAWEPPYAVGVTLKSQKKEKKKKKEIAKDPEEWSKLYHWRISVLLPGHMVFHSV